MCVCVCVCVCVRARALSRVQLFATPWTVAHQAPSVYGILQARILEWAAMPSSRGSSPLRGHPRPLLWHVDSLPVVPATWEAMYIYGWEAVSVYIYTRTYTYMYIWASLVAQTVKNLPAMQGIWVQSLGQEDSLEKGMDTHVSTLGASLVAQMAKEPTCNAGDAGLIPGSERCPGEGTG